MPLINVKLSAKKVPNTELLLKELSATLADLTGKPEKYVMCLLQTNVPMSFGGSNEPSCYVEIKSIGALRPPQMCKSYSALISSLTDIPSDRIYISFTDVPASQWGYNGQTFG